MNKKLRCLQITILFALLFFTLIACSSDNEAAESYTEIPANESEAGHEPETGQQTPVVMNLDQVPYQNLSDYRFFTGDLKNLEPAYKVLPYDLNSELFTDYALKKRFIWMPEGSQAVYTADSKILDFPVGTALIKNFYYNNVQPANTTRIVETRVMIKKQSGWIFANYIWDENQTNAVLDNTGSSTDITWMQGSEAYTISYKIPSQQDCAQCHTNNQNQIPIGPKPQNLNKNYNYTAGAKNQLQKWIDEGYLKNTLPANITSTVNWNDQAHSLDLRARSYLDINCAHCHSDNSAYAIHLRFGFEETANPEKMGVCVISDHYVVQGIPFYIAKQNPTASLVYYRMSNNRPADMMPRLGRTIVHTEGLKLIEDWINAMDAPCP